MRKLEFALAKNPLASSKTIFEQAGIDRACRKTRCNILNDIAKNTKPVSRPPLTKQHKEKRVKWATDYIKCHFSTVIFTDECRATLDGPEGFSRGWIGHGFETLFRLRRQQGGGGGMFWAGICGETLIGPFMVEEGVKMDSEAYVHFLKQNFFNSHWGYEVAKSLNAKTRQLSLSISAQTNMAAARMTEMTNLDVVFSGGSSVSQNKLPQLILGYIYILKYLQSNFIG